MCTKCFWLEGNDRDVCAMLPVLIVKKNIYRPDFSTDESAESVDFSAHARDTENRNMRARSIRVRYVKYRKRMRACWRLLPLHIPHYCAIVQLLPLLLPLPG